MQTKMMPTPDEIREAFDKIDKEFSGVAADKIKESPTAQYHIDLYKNFAKVMSGPMAEMAVRFQNGPVLALMAAFIGGFQMYEMIYESRGKRLM